MLILGSQTSGRAAAGAESILAYLRGELEGRKFERKVVSLRTANLTFLGLDPDQYRVEEVIPPPAPEERANPERWLVRAVRADGRPGHLELRDLKLPFDLHQEFGKRFDHVHPLLRFGAALFGEELGVHPPLPRTQEEAQVISSRTGGLVLSFDPPLRRPSLLDATARGDDRWFAIRSLLFYQQSESLSSKLGESTASVVKSLDLTYRTTAFAVASHGASQAARLKVSDQIAGLLDVVRERLEFCAAIHEKNPHHKGRINTAWAIVAAAALAELLAYAMPKLFNADSRSGKKSLGTTILRKWRESTAERLSVLSEGTIRDARFTRLTGRARNLLDRTDLHGQKQASLAVLALEFAQQSFLADARLLEAE